MLGGFLGIGFLGRYSIRRRRSRSKSTTPAAPSMDLVGRLTYSELFKATDGFSPRNLAGVGSFGSVYKANIGGDQLCADPSTYNNTSGGKLVAVKVINLQQQGASKSFMAECEALRNIRHRNLLKILTSCSSIDHSGNSFKALVFEYMTNGSLDKWLHHPAAAPADTQQISYDHHGAAPEGGADDHDHEVMIITSCTTRGGRLISLMQRLSIAIDVASALEYLHVGSHRRIIHCDLKPSNVLLDDEMTAHVADFGLARFLASTDHTSSAATPSSLSAVRGTVGYAAPEYGMGCRPSTQGDVYSYGILLLEMITGRRPTDAMFKEEFTLRKFVETSFPARVLDVVDQKLLLMQVEEVVLRDHGHEIMSTTGARFQNGGEVTTFGEGTREYGVVSSMLSIALRCSNESPRERMKMEDVVKEMIATRNAFQKRSRHGKRSHEHGVRGGQRMLTDHHASTALI